MAVRPCGTAAEASVNWRIGRRGGGGGHKYLCERRDKQKKQIQLEHDKAKSSG